MKRIASSINYISYKLSRKKTVVGALITLALLSWVAVFANAKNSELEVRFFDVGQGDAIFIELPDGRQILIDGGPDSKVVEKLNSAMPFWDREIDIIIATHADADHITGLVPVLAHYDADLIIWNGIEANTEIFKEWKEAVAEEGAEVLIAEYGTRINFSEIAFFEILWPPLRSSSSPPSSADRRTSEGRGAGQAPPEINTSQNDFSIVIRFVYGEDSFLFTGDIERQSEYEVVQKNLNIESDILKIAHHGSKTSSSELFLEKVNPKIAIISVGKNNSYGHPYQAVLGRLEKYGIFIRRTDNEGDIIVSSNGDSL